LDGCKEAKTNSGESILAICERKACFQGAVGTLSWWVVVDIVRRRERRRRAGGEAMFDEFEG